MRALRNKTNVQAPDADYLYGRIKDDPGDNTGTPVNEQVYGDMHQFFEKLMFDSGLSANNLPENAYSGFQLNQALQNRINALAAILVAAEAVIRAAADTAINAAIATTIYTPSSFSGSGAKNIAVIDLSIYSGSNIMIKVGVAARNASAAGEGTWNEDILSFRSNGGTLVQIGATANLNNRTNGASAPTITYSIAGMVLTVIGNSSSGLALTTYQIRVQTLLA